MDTVSHLTACVVGLVATHQASLHTRLLVSLPAFLPACLPAACLPACLHGRVVEGGSWVGLCRLHVSQYLHPCCSQSGNHSAHCTTFIQPQRVLLCHNNTPAAGPHTHQATHPYTHYVYSSLYAPVQHTQAIVDRHQYVGSSSNQALHQVIAHN